MDPKNDLPFDVKMAEICGQRVRIIADGRCGAISQVQRCGPYVQYEVQLDDGQFCHGPMRLFGTIQDCEGA